VDLLIVLGALLIATQGFTAPEAGEIYIRAQHLCEHLDDPHQLFPVLRGRWNYYHVRAEHQTAHALGEQLLTLAQQVQDTAMLIATHHSTAAVCRVRPSQESLSKRPGKRIPTKGSLFFAPKLREPRGAQLREP
jgi:hypothetical protein